jgi:hypothetical protein
MLVYTFGVFAKPLTTEFKTSRGAISLALTLTNFTVAVGAPGAGWLVDRLGARRVITCSILAFTPARPLPGDHLLQRSQTGHRNHLSGRLYFEARSPTWDLCSSH